MNSTVPRLLAAFNLKVSLPLLLTLIAALFSLTSLPLVAQPQSGLDTNLKQFQIRNIGFICNTPELEYAPTITADGKTLYFVSDRPGGVGGHDFWITKKEKRLDTVFSAPTNLGRPINTELNEGVASIAADGQTIFFTGCNRPDGLGDCDLYEAELDGNQWINVRNVSEINSPYWDSQPSISSDGKTLYFVSNRPGALGGDGDRDIYYATRQADGKWSAPKNMGPPINTTDREDSPFIIAGSGAIYFSSAGHGGFGGLDFFVSKKLPGGGFGEPENLGEPFNTSKDERFITLPAAGDVVYFSSERTDLPNAGKLDIYMGILPPRTVAVLIQGRVFDKCTNGNLPTDLIFVNDATGDTLYTAKTNMTSGEYSFVVNAEGKMRIKVYGESPGYDAIRDTIIVPEVKEYTEIRRDYPLGEGPKIGATYGIADYIKDLPPDAPAKYREFRGLLIEENLVKELYPLLTYVFFDSGSAKIPDRYILFTDPSQTQRFSDTTIPGGTLQKYYHMLNIVGFRLRQYPNTNITITGCNSGEPAINEIKDVSEQRGKIVYDYLINIWQINASRVKLLPARDLPQEPSNRRDPLGLIENRRAEIRSDDYEIVRPIVQKDLRRYPQPDTMHFQMRNGINDALVARRVIEIKRHGKIWHLIPNIGTTDPVSPAYNWGKNGDVDSIPNDETPYTAQLVVYSADGKECRSNIIEIPVEIVTNEEKRRERLVDKTIDRYSLVLFKFDSPEAGALNERILKEFVYNDIRPGAKIKVTGYTDVIGLEDRNLRLSEQRAATVTNGVKKNVRSGLYQSLEGKGVGETAPLYTNDLPEGRFYNRTVQVIIDTPTKIE
jgi:outer membrane protein OmpA-like peptidoglycan-associated protein